MERSEDLKLKGEYKSLYMENAAFADTFGTKSVKRIFFVLPQEKTQKLLDGSCGKDVKGTFFVPIINSRDCCW